MIKKIFSTIMVVLMVASLTVGCSNNNKTTKSTEVDANNLPVVDKGSENETTNSDTEKEIEEIVLGENHDINAGFAPAYAASGGWGSFYYLGNFYETLVNYDNGEIKPGLAESWEENENEITFKLRKGIKFTDGSDFNAEVVKKNLEMMPRILGEAMTGCYSALSKLEEVKVIDKYTVKLVLIENYNGALQELTMVRPMGMMSLNAYTEEGLSDEVYSKTFGTGKYMIENAVQGEDYTFVRNDNYWGEKPKVKQFVVKTISDMDSRIMALRNGEIDMIFGASNITYDAFSEFKDDDKFLAKVSESKVKTKNVVLNTTQIPFDDVNVRLATQYAIDKQVICDSLFYGIEEKADYLFNSDLPYCNLSLKPYSYNVEKAKELLDQAGWVEVEGSNIREKNGKKLKTDILYEAGSSSDENLMLAITGQLKEIGFDIDATGLDITTCMGKTMSGDFKMFATKSYGIPYEPYLEIAVMTKTGWHNPAQQGLSEKKELDFKINEVSKMTNQDKIQETYNYILTTLHDEAVYIPISYQKELVIFNKEKIKDYKFNGQALNLDISGVVSNDN